MLKKFLQSYNLMLLHAYGLMVLRSYALTVLLIFSVLQLSAQRYPYEFSVYCEGGFNAFIIQKPESKATSKGYGGDAGVGFTYFFSQNLGLHTGAGFGFFHVGNGINTLNFINPDREDCDGNLYDLYTTLNNYYENHHSLFLTLPLMLQFQTKMQPISYRQNSSKAGFYAMAGAKALLMIQNNYLVGVISLYNMAYYPNLNNWITNQPALGLGAFQGRSVIGNLKFKALAMVALETGLKWQFGKKLLLYTGAYFDCGLYDYTKKSRVSYDGFATQESLSELALLDFAKRMNLVAAGVKVRLAFSGQKTKSSCH